MPPNCNTVTNVVVTNIQTSPVDLRTDSRPIVVLFVTGSLQRLLTVLCNLPTFRSDLWFDL